jgi:hypothetical protein
MYQDDFEVSFVVIPTKEESHTVLKLCDCFACSLCSSPPSLEYKIAVYSRINPYGLMQF